MILLVVALGVLFGGGLIALAATRSARLASACGAGFTVLGCLLGEAYAFQALSSRTGGALALRWEVPYGWLRIGMDPLSAFFLVPIFGLGGLAAPYGAAYLYPRRGEKTLGPVWLAYAVLLASMALVVVARQAVLFLVAWEVMSLSAFVCVTFEQEDREAARGGWAYLIASHVGTAALLVLFLLYNRHAHGFAFDAFRTASLRPPVAAVLAVLALVGFGVKAGFVPLHVWLPEAHAAAPSHVSAVMSGVLINMGLYGVLRTLWLLRLQATWVGIVLVSVGLAGAVMGIALASYQRDMKRVLAYSSIENMGLITLGVGIGYWGWASGHSEVATLGLAGALLHLYNHTLMKGLMFLAAGSVLHGAGTKDLERLGGMLKPMPRTGSLMMLGSVAIAGLPPLNGFVSEWLLYLALLRAALSSTGAASVLLLVAVGVVSLVGALAGLAFVRLVGTALLGQPRSDSPGHAHESPLPMIAPMALLAAMCVVIGLYPQGVLGGVSSVGAELFGHPAGFVVDGAPLAMLASFNAGAWSLFGLGAAGAAFVLRRGGVAADVTWGCGYARPSARMQYTARAFSEMLSERLLPGLLRARISSRQPTGIFPPPAALASDCRDPMTRGFYEPFIGRWGDRFARLRWMQQGVLHIYLVYILAALLGGLAWSSFVSWRAG
ncbi:MAG TPA: proton-conducting transporter membrane subunit [Polyangiaceae bacterium]|nr:proton-conducting transporter membrane subunit [Polyangiaceae bacterium]